MLQSDALAHEPRESPAIIFHGNGSVGATGRRCRYKLAASGGSAGCVRQLEAPIWLTPIAGGYETARKRRFFDERSLWRGVVLASASWAAFPCTPRKPLSAESKFLFPEGSGAGISTPSASADPLLAGAGTAASAVVGCSRERARAASSALADIAAGSRCYPRDVFAAARPLLLASLARRPFKPRSRWCSLLGPATSRPRGLCILVCRSLRATLQVQSAALQLSQPRPGCALRSQVRAREAGARARAARLSGPRLASGSRQQPAEES